MPTTLNYLPTSSWQPGESYLQYQQRIAAPTTGSTGTPGTFNVSPAPRTGQGPFGLVPGNVGVPTPAADLGTQYPNLSGTNATISGNILAGLEGQLSPGTIAALQDANAAWGVSSGMPGSGLVRNRGARNLGLTAEQLQAQALQQYNQTIPTISRTQTVSPELQSEIAQWNAIMNAAPDPAQAQNYAQGLFAAYMQALGGGRGPGGGTGGRGGGMPYMPQSEPVASRINTETSPYYMPHPYAPPTATGDASASSLYAGTDVSPQDFYYATGFTPDDLSALNLSPQEALSYGGDASSDWSWDF